MVAREGFEPSTLSLYGTSYAAELPRRKYMAAKDGFEPPPSPFGGGPLRRRASWHGTPGRIRTDDLAGRNRVL